MNGYGYSGPAQSTSGYSGQSEYYRYPDAPQSQQQRYPQQQPQRQQQQQLSYRHPSLHHAQQTNTARYPNSLDVESQYDQHAQFPNDRPSVNNNNPNLHRSIGHAYRSDRVFPSAPSAVKADLYAPQGFPQPSRQANLPHRTDAYASKSAYVDTDRPSLSLPVLKESHSTSGFGDFYNQLDQIQNKYSPVASPITPRFDSSGRQWPSRQALAERDTPTSSPYNPTANIISMYEGGQSPVAVPNLRMTGLPSSAQGGLNELSDTNQLHRFAPSSAPSESPYPTGMRNERQHSVDSHLAEANSWQQAFPRESHPRPLQSPPNTYTGRSRTPSAGTDVTASGYTSRGDSNPSQTALPASHDSSSTSTPSTHYTTSSTSSSLASTRPSQDSYKGLSHGTSYGYSASSSNPFLASSSDASGSTRSLSSRRAGRPLPVPIEESDRPSFSSNLSPSMSSIQRQSHEQLSSQSPAELQRGSSEFAQDFYRSGTDIPDEIKYPKRRAFVKPIVSQHSEQRTTSPETSVPTNYNDQISHSNSIAARSTASSNAHHVINHSGTRNNTVPTFSSSAIQLSSQPPLLHSRSDPLSETAAPGPVISSKKSGIYQQTRVPPSEASALAQGSLAGRSASFSVSSASTSSAQHPPSTTYGRRNASFSSAKRPDRNALPDTTPPPTSPAISISPSLPDTFYASPDGVTPSSSIRVTGLRARNNSNLSPSSHSLSLRENGGYFGSMANLSMASMRKQSEKDRQRMEKMGLQHLNPALLSHIASAVKSRVPRNPMTKNSITHDNSFTGEQIISSIAEILPFPYTEDRKIALKLAQTLLSNIFFHEVEWDDIRLRDNDESVLCFESEEESQSTYDYLSQFDSPEGTLSPTQKQEDDLPNGVITRFTKCYSPFCGMEGTMNSGACYSPFCPNGATPLGLQRKASSISLTASPAEVEQITWNATVTPAVIKATEPKEILRQNRLFEAVASEKKYKRDLDFFATSYRDMLLAADPPVIQPASRLRNFCNKVFANLDDVRSHASRLLEALLARQREQTPLLQGIGDLFLDAALDWGDTYLKYVEAMPVGESLFEQEKASNSAFSAFLQQRGSLDEQRLDFRNYYMAPFNKIARYDLLLSAVLKVTPEDHPDHEMMQEAIRLTVAQAEACNVAKAASELKLACQVYDKLIERDANYSQLDLKDPIRQLKHHGKMFSKPEGTLAEWQDYQVILFDHFLCIAKPRRAGGGYRLLRKPIRLELLTVTGFDDSAQTKSSGFHLRSVIGQGDRREISGASYGNYESKVYPIVFKISGRGSGTITLYVEGTARSDDARRKWKKFLEEAMSARQQLLKANEVFKVRVLVDPEIRKETFTPPLNIGRVLCSCPFNGPSGQLLVAIGTTCGLFISMRRDPTTLRQILQIPVSQCSVLQDFGLFLVQTEGRLLAYLLDALVQTQVGETKGQQGPQQVSGQKDITFFRTGVIGPRTLVVYAKKDGVSSTVLKIIEPVAPSERGRSQQGRFLGMGGKKSEWLRPFKEGAVPTEVYTLSFTRKKLALVCAPGFEILDIETLKTGSFPDWHALRPNAGRHDSRLANLHKRCSESKALALFRITESEYLFCYDNFAFFADRLGDPLPDRYDDLIEWEGQPSSVVFYAPYVLAFEPRFVEVRDTSNRGRLVQFINGSGIRCSYDGQGVPPSEINARLGSRHAAEEKKPHFVKNEGNFDKVYELVPCRSN